MTTDLQQILAASALITKLERIASSGVLSLEDEIDARELIVKAARAFQFDTLAERPLPSNVIDLDTAAQAMVRREMADG